jgi:hypothetical protein
MTKKRLIVLFLISLYAVFIFVVGCVPEDSLQWSQDGSVGLYSKKGALFLVDGNTGSLTQVEPNESTCPWPGISPDGNYLAYGQVVKVTDFNNALNLLPQSQVNQIKNNAELLKQRILAEGLKSDELPWPKDSFGGQFISWVNRFLVENSNTVLDEKIGPELIKKVKEGKLYYFQLVLAPTAEPGNKKILATNSLKFWRIIFSPDSRLIAFSTDRISGDSFQVGFDLFVCSPAENIPSALVAPAVSIGYNFKPDSRAIVYMKPENENFDGDNFVLGSLVEKEVADSDGKLLVSAVEDADKAVPEYNCTGLSEELCGLSYYQWMFAEYAPDGRIFFSSVEMKLPSSKLDEEKGTLFCYDSLTGAVSEILPQVVLDYTQSNFYLFSLSHDYKKILFPGNKNTLGIYALGEDIDSSKVLVDADEGFGDDSPPKLVPEWKGPDEVSCLVSEESHFLPGEPNAPHRRKEIVILDTEGNLKQILSKDWPDKLLDFGN